jgi:hypothetical protein
MIPNSLYEQDYTLWLETTVALLRQKEFASLDLENLIEEIESMGRREKAGVVQSINYVINASTQMGVSSFLSLE